MIYREKSYKVDEEYKGEKKNRHKKSTKGKFEYELLKSESDIHRTQTLEEDNAVHY